MSKYTLFFVLLISFVIVAFPENAYAQQVQRCGTDNSGILTAVGCIPVNDQTNLVAFFLRWLMGISGGIAFLLIIWSGIQIMTAQGDPQKLQAGREVLTAAISGLIFIIFSVFLLYLIGVRILNIPGL